MYRELFAGVQPGCATRFSNGQQDADRYKYEEFPRRWPINYVNDLACRFGKYVHILERNADRQVDAPAIGGPDAGTGIELGTLGVVPLVRQVVDACAQVQARADLVRRG